MSQKILSGTDAVRAGFASVAVFFGVLTAGLWCDRLYQKAVQPVRSVIETVEPGTWSDCPNGGLVADPESLNFGRRTRGKSFNWELRLFNPTCDPVRIEGFHGICGGWVSNSEIHLIQPGKSCIVPMRFDIRATDRADQQVEKNVQWLIIPKIPDHPGRHSGWQVGGTIVSADDQ